MSKIRMTASGLVTSWAFSLAVCAPISYLWGREASGWEAPPPGIIQGADSNEILSVLPHVATRFGLLALLATALWLYVGYRQVCAKRPTRGVTPTS
ncbi:hypothetical protein [Streptomyces sp. NBC_01304]|uniref:hypothetical protein n=1 Tax=Streptomyces sp. NBC_01304 TaxID=2903818 RepID=UPI002E161731|nr:hypothetical protein OG430_08955 [Streptomyces sp. NBC_01304]